MRSLRSAALVNAYLWFAAIAFDQQETGLGQELCREAARADPTVLEGRPCPLVSRFMTYCTDDIHRDHASVLPRMLAQLPVEMAHVANQAQLAIGRGHLVLGVREILWGRLEEGRCYLERARALRASIDEQLSGQLTAQLLRFETGLGGKVAEAALNSLAPAIQSTTGRTSARRLAASYRLNRAFRNYHRGDFAGVARDALAAMANDRQYLANRGAWSVLLRSVLHA